MTWRGGNLSDVDRGDLSDVERGDLSDVDRWDLSDVEMGDLSDVERGDLLHGQQLVFHITLAQACVLERTLQRRCKATIQTEK